MKDHKTMQYANFNITFGDKEEPMLEHFEDIVFPALTSDLKRSRGNDYPIFYFNDVEIKKVEEEYVLVGNCIKDTEYNVRTVVKNGELTPAPAQVPTAPYSRFIIFLKNHRMILVRNETFSPDIRSFQATVRDILKQYIRMKNKERENKLDPLPYSIVNIVDIPLKDDIEDILKKVKKIDWVRLRFFPPNHDMNRLPVAQAINEEMKKVGSKTANAQFNSPDSKQGVQKMLVDTAGYAGVTMKVTDVNGETRRIKEDTFTSNKKIPYRGDLTEEHDEHLIFLAQKDEVIDETSEENFSLYKRFINVFKKLMLSK